MGTAAAVLDVPSVTTPAPAGVTGIAAAVAASVRETPGCWTLPEPHPSERTSVRAAATDDFDVWLLRWPSGTRVAPHDHGDSVGAFCVVDGALVEVRWQDGEPVARRVYEGETVAFGRGVVHDVVGATDGALSVHVYSPPLAAMAFYDDEGATRLVRHETVDG